MKSQRCSEPWSLPLYGQVPKEMKENLAYRTEVLSRAATDLEFQRTLWLACKRDMLFWINTFVWTFDPRKPNPKLPFITYGYQDEAFLAMEEALPSEDGLIKGNDVIIEKSRDMGASWICLTLFTWRWHFRNLQSFLMVSRKEGLVDGSGDSLFSHIDFIQKGLPSWMLPQMRRNKLKLINLDNGSKIEGESTTDNIGRGGRRTAMLVDEFAAFEGGGYDVLSATADNTNCRVFNSTPNGTANAFYAQLQKGTPRLRFHWSRHPEKAEGIYEGPDGRSRSPWYDKECERRAHPVEIATQLDIDYQGSAYPFMDPKTLEDLAKEFARVPDHQGHLAFEDMRNPEFMDSMEGRGNLKVWTPLDVHLKPSDMHDYVIGVDVSQGTGASESAASVIDRHTGEKVAELADNQITPNKFAELCVALCHWFKGPGGRPAFLIWEATGPGRTFGKTVIEECRFGNVYYAINDQRITKRESDRPGWFSTQEGKKDLLANYRDVLFSRVFINPSKKALRQAGEFVYLPNGRVEHGGAVNTIDPTDKGDNHGDVVIADALAAKIIRERKKAEVKRRDAGPPAGSFAWRRQQRETVLDEWDT